MKYAGLAIAAVAIWLAGAETYTSGFMRCAGAGSASMR